MENGVFHERGQMAKAKKSLTHAKNDNSLNKEQ